MMGRTADNRSSHQRMFTVCVSQILPKGGATLPPLKNTPVQFDVNLFVREYDGPPNSDSATKTSYSFLNDALFIGVQKTHKQRSLATNNSFVVVLQS